MKLFVVSTYRLPAVLGAGREAKVPVDTVPVPPPLSKTFNPFTVGISSNVYEPDAIVGISFPYPIFIT